MNTAHRIEIKASNRQRTYFARASGTARFSYNWALAECKKEYEAGGKPSEAALRRKLNSIKRTEFPWTLEVSKNAPQEAIRQLGGAYKRFFKGEAKYPKRRKKGIDDRFTLSNDQFEVKGNRIRIPHLGRVRLRESFRYKGKISGATIARDADRWFVSISVDAVEVHDRNSEAWKPFPERRESQAAVGVDLGLTTFATLSTGEEVVGPKPHKKLLSRLRRLQQSLSRKQKGSKNRGKAKQKLAKLHRRIRNIRSDAIHKLTHRLVQEHSIIGIETLNVKGMVRNRCLARSVSDMGFHEFRRQITYKLERQGEKPVLAGPLVSVQQALLNTRLWPCDEETPAPDAAMDLSGLWYKASARFECSHQFKEFGREFHGDSLWSVIWRRNGGAQKAPTVNESWRVEAGIQHRICSVMSRFG